MISIQIKLFLLYTTSEYNTITTMDNYTNLSQYVPDTDSQHSENMNTSDGLQLHFWNLQNIQLNLENTLGLTQTL